MLVLCYMNKTSPREKVLVATHMTQCMKMPSEVVGQRVRAASEDGRDETVNHDEMHRIYIFADPRSF